MGFTLASFSASGTPSHVTWNHSMASPAGTTDAVFASCHSGKRTVYQSLFILIYIRRGVGPLRLLISRGKTFYPSEK